MTEKKIRDRVDIVRAHDILDEVLNNPEISKLIDWDDTIKSEMIGIKRTLCWVLNHDEGRWFSENMERLQHAIKELGFDLKHIQ